MDDKEFSNVFSIPANYTDSGKILGGMLEPRNAIEALILIVLIGYPELMLIPMPSTIRIVVMTVTLIPLGVVALMGIDGDSLFQYLARFESSAYMMLSKVIRALFSFVFTISPLSFLMEIEEIASSSAA